MKLSDLRKIARSQNFDFSRVSRVHSSLYRLASDIPETGSPAYFNSVYSLLAYVTLSENQIAVLSIGNTHQYSFYQIRRFDVLSVHIRPVDWTPVI